MRDTRPSGHVAIELRGAEPVGRQHERAPRALRGRGIDGRIAHHHRESGRRSRERAKSGRVGLPRMRAVPAQHHREEPAQTELVEDLLRGRARLVRQHGQRSGTEQHREHFVHAFVGHGVIEQVPVVDGHEPLQRPGRVGIEAHVRQRALHQDPRTLTHHPDHVGNGQGRSAVPLHELGRGLGEVARRVDERAVQVEDNHRSVRLSSPKVCCIKHAHEP